MSRQAQLSLPILMILLFTSSCASPVSSKTNVKCESDNQSIISRHIALKATYQKNSLVRCFQNFLQFEQNKEQKIHVCNTLNVAKSGKVTYAKVNGIKLPKDLKMCLEQELWSMNFKSLQPETDILVRFPITFSSR